MKHIQLTRGETALVDDEDFDNLNKFKWHSHRNGVLCYASRATKKDNGQQTVCMMHRQILSPETGISIDHIDGNGLNNQKSNLRMCTHTENMRNRRINDNNTSGYKGVSWDKERNKWRACIRAGGEKIFLGKFTDKLDAYVAYCEASKKYHKNFSRVV